LDPDRLRYVRVRRREVGPVEPELVRRRERRELSGSLGHLEGGAARRDPDDELCAAFGARRTEADAVSVLQYQLALDLLAVDVGPGRASPVGQDEALAAPSDLRVGWLDVPEQELEIGVRARSEDAGGRRVVYREGRPVERAPGDHEGR